MIKVLLHGGLGNQLFQFFFAVVVQRKLACRRVLLICDFLGRYASRREIEIPSVLSNQVGAFEVELGLADPLARLRLPKVLHRAFGFETYYRIPLYGVLIDGYFQDPHPYAEFDPAVFREIISEWRTATSAGCDVRKRDRVVHMRLGDFFDSADDARDLATSRLLQTAGEFDLITDQDELVESVLYHNKLDRVKLIRTRGFSSWPYCMSWPPIDALMQMGHRWLFGPAS